MILEPNIMKNKEGKREKIASETDCHFRDIPVTLLLFVQLLGLENLTSRYPNDSYNIPLETSLSIDNVRI